MTTTKQIKQKQQSPQSLSVLGPSGPGSHPGVCAGALYREGEAMQAMIQEPTVKEIRAQEKRRTAYEKNQAYNVRIGQAVQAFLSLSTNHNGRYETSWGTKSLEGLGNCVRRIIDDERKVKQ